MLKHTTISKINFKGYQIALVETSTDYVVATDYKGHKECWGQGHYYPKSTDPDQDLKARESAGNCYVELISRETTYWL